MADVHTNYLERLLARSEDIDRLLACSKEVELPPADMLDELERALIQRGALQSEIGLAQAGLTDLLRARMLQTTRDVGYLEASFDDLLRGYQATRDKEQNASVELQAQLGECLRTYTRDVLLSSSRKGAVKEVVKFSDMSRDCFRRALNRLPEERLRVPSVRQRYAWILAHEAAVCTMQYWMALSVGKARDNAAETQAAKKLFSCAETGFRQAERHYRELGKSYDWAKRFRAFLYALRGKNDARDQDYLRARLLLLELEGSSASEQSSFDRSLAMLASYDVFDERAAECQALAQKALDGSPGEFDADATCRGRDVLCVREESARESMERGFSAIQKDPEEFVAAYFAASSQWYLAENARDLKERRRLEASLDSTLSAAAIRANNAISQALTSLAGVHLLQALRWTPGQGSADPAKSAKKVLALLREFEPDLETRAMFYRNVLWTKIRDMDSEVSSRIQTVLEQDNFDELQRLFSIDWGEREEQH